MIKIRNLKKSFINQEVLNIPSLDFPDKGLFVLYGPSGSGKSTLLNIISGLEDYSGEVNVFSHNYHMMNDEQKDLYRLKNIGFVFQDFKLFENQTVKNNILFPLLTIEGKKKEKQDIKINTLLEYVNLKNKIDQPINNLSGGEKQRVAIARAIINNPKILLADEPTGALDHQNGIIVMDILKKLSNSCLVILVTHDYGLAQKYGDTILYLSDGKIIKKEILNNKSKEKLSLSLAPYNERKPSIPLSFLTSHYSTTNKKRKWRSRIVHLLTSLGLIGIGLASTISSSISNGVKKSYSSLIEDNQIILSNENNNDYIQYAGSLYEASELLKKYPDYIYDIGVTYDNNFESFFPQQNYSYIAETKYCEPIHKISARHINEFRWLDLENIVIYPEKVNTLEDDQIILGLSIDIIEDICFQLQIVRTVTSLSEYLIAHPLHLCFSFGNDEWEYVDEQIVEIKGFTLTKNPCIYHDNHLWNEYMFEDRMRFPTSDIINLPSYYPWTLKKIYYFNTHKLTDAFMQLTKLNADFDPFLFELANNKYYPWMYGNTDIKEIDRVLIFANNKDYFLPRYEHYFPSLIPEYQNMVLGSDSGIMILPNNLLYGFSNHIFFSKDLEQLNYYVSKIENLNNEEFAAFQPEEDILIGHYSKAFNHGVSFSAIDQNKYKIDSLDEIFISQKMAEFLFHKVDVVNEKIYLSCLVSSYSDSEGKIYRKFQNVEIVIKGVIESDQYKIYHNYLWPILFFQCRLGISIFNLLTQNISISFTKKCNMDLAKSKIQKAFPKYIVNDPLSEIVKGVDQVCFYIEIALMIFSLIAVVISSILLSVCNSLYILENKKDIALARCLGINKKESYKFPLTYSVMSCFSSFLLSSVELFVISFIITYETGQQLGGGFFYYINPISFVLMGTLALVLSFVVTIINTRKLNKFNPLEALKQ